MAVRVCGVAHGHLHQPMQTLVMEMLHFWEKLLLDFWAPQLTQCSNLLGGAVARTLLACC